MEWKLMGKLDAKGLLNRWLDNGYYSFMQMIDSLNSENGPLNKEYHELRQELLKAWRETNREIEAKPEYKSRKAYLTDILFGRKMYEILKNKGMDVRFASYDKVWIYLDVQVVPDIVFERFNESEYRKNKKFVLSRDHFYNKSVRIYLKTLWWYIYLSMRFDSNGREDLDKTLQMLWAPNMNTDTILQMVERTGREGFRVDVSRDLISYYSKHSKLNANDFRQVMNLNTARSQVIEAGLSEGYDEGYVNNLYAYFKSK